MRKTLLSLVVMTLLSVLPSIAATSFVLDTVSFENGVLPAGWTQEAVVGTRNNVWAVEGGAGVTLTNPAGAKSGVYRLAARGGNTVEAFVTKLILPSLNLLDEDVFQPKLQFAYAQAVNIAGGVDYLDTLTVYYRTSPSAPWVMLKKYDREASKWRTAVINLPDAALTSTFQLAFEISAHGGRGVVLDDINIYNGSQCQDAIFTKVQVTSSESAELEYMCGGTFTEFELLVTKAPVADKDNVADSLVVYRDTTFELSASLTGLENNTHYYVYLRTDCADNVTGYTNWVEADFTTTRKVSLPYVEDFNVTETTGYVLPVGWTAGAATGKKAPYVPAGATATSKNYLSNDSTKYLSFAAAQSTSYTSLTAVAEKSYAYAATPEINATINTCEVEFWATAYTYFYNGVKDYEAAIEVGVMIDPTDWSTFTSVKKVTLDCAQQFKKFTVSLADYQGAGRYIALASNNFGKQNLVFVDNFSVQAISETPEDVQVANVLPTGFDVTADGPFSVKVFEATDYVKGGVLPAGAALAEATATAGVAHVTVTESMQGKTLLVYAVNDGHCAFPVSVVVPTVAVVPDTLTFNTSKSVNIRNLAVEIHPSTSLTIVEGLFFPYKNNTNLYPAYQANGYDKGVLKLYGIDNYVVLPYVNDLTGLEVAFRLSAGATTMADQSKVAVGIMTDPYDLSTFVELGTYAGGSGSGKSAYLKCEQDFAAYTGAGHYVAIRAIEPTKSNTSYGSVNLIDNLILQPVPTCREAVNVSVVTTANEATATWNAAGMTEWKVSLYANEACTQLLGDSVVNQNTITIGGLNSETTYYFVISTICGSDTLVGEDVHSFTTLFGLPYTEGFETASSAMSQWILPTGVTRTTSSYVRTGSYSLKFATTSTVVTVLPELDGLDGFTEFSFWWRCEGTGTTSTMGYIEAGYVTDASDANSFVALLDCPNHMYAYTYESVMLPAALPAGARVAFRYSRATSAAWYLFVDDVKLRRLDPNCMGLSKLDVTADESSISMDWAAGGTQSMYVHVATTANFSDTVFAGDVTANPFELNNLPSNTLYYIRARQSCDKAGETVLSTSVRTACGAITPAQLGTVTFTGTDVLDCWKVGIGDTTGTGMSAASYTSYSPKRATAASTYGAYLYMNKPANTATVNYGNNYYALMPQLAIDSITKYQVSFQAATNNAKYASKLIVGVTYSPDNLATFAAIDTLNVKYAADSTKMNEYIVGFGDYKGDFRGRYGKYVTFIMTGPDSVASNVLIDNVTVEPLTNCHPVQDVIMDVVTPNSASFHWNTKAIGYQVVVADTVCHKFASLPASHIISNHIVNAAKDSVSNLTSYSQYCIFVRAICAAGDTAAWSSGFGFKTEIGVPYLEAFDDFALGYPSDGWVGYRGATISGTAVNVANLTENTSSTYGWYVSNTAAQIGTSMVGRAVRTEVYSTSYNALLTSPKIVLPEAVEGYGYRVSFRIARKPYSTSSTTIANATDHFFKVLVSTDGVNYNKVASWEVGKGDFEYNDITMTGISGKADLTDYAGQTIYLGFMTGTESASTPDTYFSMDSVAVSTYSTACGGAANLNVTSNGLSAVATWKVTGAPAKSIIEFSELADFSTLISSDTLENVFTKSYTVNRYNATYYVRVKQAECADARWISTTFKTPLALPFQEVFTSTTLPADWSRRTGDIFANTATSTTSGWFITSSNGAGFNTYHAYSYVSTTTAGVASRYSLITPEMVMLNEAGNHIKLTFDLALTTGSTTTTSPTAANCVGHTFAVLVSTDGGATWQTDSTMIMTGADYVAIPATAASYEFDLTAYAGQRAMIAFYHGADSTSTSTSTYINLDNIKLQSLNLNCLAPVVNILHMGADSVEVSLSGAATSYELQIAKDADFVKYDSLVVNDTIAVLRNLVSATQYGVRARSLCDAGARSGWSEVVLFSTECAPIVEFPWSEDFNKYTSTADFSDPCFLNIPWLAGTGSSGSSGLVFKTYVGTTGGNSTTKLQLPDQKAGTLTRLYLPLMQFDSTLLYEFGIDVYRQSASTHASEGVRIILVDEDDVETVVDKISRDYATPGLTVPAETAEGWYTYYFALPHDGKVYRIVLQGESDYGLSTYMDNLTVISSDPNCLAPTLDLKEVTADSVVIALDSIANDYMVLVSGTADFAKADTIRVTGDTIVSIGGLNPSTIYYVRAYLLCSGNKKSSASKDLVFKTECRPATLPYFEGFENFPIGSSSSSAAPDCWWISPTNNGSAPYVYVSSTYTKTGSRSFYGYGSSTTDKFAILPVIDADLKDLRMTFEYRASTTSTTYNFYVGYLRTVDNKVVTVKTLPLTSTTFQTATVEFTNVPDSIGRDYRLAFMYRGSAGIYVDDINVFLRPLDETLESVSISNVERRSFDVNWTPKASTECSNYDLVISKTVLNDAALDTMACVNLNATTYHAEGLDRNTTYHVYVRTSCAAGTSAHGKWYHAETKTKSLSACDQAQIGNGSATAYLIYTSYGNSYSQHIYTAAELTAAGLTAGPITSLSFEFTSGTSSYTKMQTIYMGHTTLSAYASSTATSFIGGLTTVFETQEMTKAEGWVAYDLTTPFVWDGVSNIVVGFLSNYNGVDGAGTSTGWANYGTSGSAYTTIYRYRDNTPVDVDNLASVSLGSYSMTRPNIRFTNCYETPACPAVENVSVHLTGEGVTTALASWTAGAGDYANTYDVIVSDSVIADFSTVTPTYTAIDSLSLELNNLEPATRYYIYVRVVCDAEGKNDGASAWTMGTVKTRNTCNDVEGLALDLQSRTSFRATWASLAQGDTYKYIVSTTKIDELTLETAASTAVADTTVLLAGLQLNTKYYFYIAHTCGTESGFWTVDSITTLPTCIQVTNLHTVSVAYNAVQIAWNRGRFGEETEWEVGIVGQESNARHYTDSTAIIIGLDADTDYTFYVKAVCDATDSSLAATLVVKTAANPGEDATLGTGTASSYLVYTSYGSSYTQHIYTAEELNAMGYTGGEILAATFTYTGNPTSQKTQTMYIGTTDKANFNTLNSTSVTLADFVAPDELLEVYAPETYTVTAGEKRYDFASPFMWDGTSNIVVAMLTNGGTTGSSTSTGWSAAGTSMTPDYYSIYTYKDNTVLDPAALTSTLFSRTQVRPNVVFSFASPACNRAKQIKATDITTTSAKLSWFPGASETMWQVVLSDSVLTDAQLAAADKDTMNYEMTKTYTGLTPDWDYYFYIQSLCSATEHSDWSSYKFQTAPTCEIPTNLDVIDSTLTSTSLTLKWDEMGAGSYTVAYGQKNTFNLSDTTTYQTITISDTTVAISGLSARTTYSFVVRAHCGAADGNSRWSNVLDVLTDCGAISEFPYEENFDDKSKWVLSGSYNYPDCWSYGGYSSTYYPHIMANTSTLRYSASDTAALYISQSSTYASNPSFVVTPEIDGNMDTLVLKFKMRACTQSLTTGNISSNYTTSTYAKSIKVASASLSDNTYTIHHLATFELQTTFATSAPLNEANDFGWEEFELPLAGVTDPYLVFYSDFSKSNYVYIDDIRIEYLPACQRPVVDVESVTATGATLTWTGGADSWNAYLVANKDTILYNNLASDTLTLTGLKAATTYTFYVQGVCGADSSVWGKAEFTTECAAISTYPWIEDFEGLTAGIPFCWDNTKGTTTNESYRFNYYEDTDKNKCVCFNSFSNSMGLTNYLVTPEILVDTTLTLSFRYKNPTGGAFAVQVSKDNGRTFTTLKAGMTGQTKWKEEAFHLDAFVGQTIRVYFFATSNYGNGDAYIYVDDVMVNTYNENCQGVDNLAVSNVTTLGVDVNFNYIAGVRNAVVDLSNTSDFATILASDTLTNDSTCHFSGLRASTTYYVRAKQLCGAGEESSYAVISFATGLGTPYDPTFTAIPADWSRYSYLINDISDNATYRTSSFTSTTSGWNYIAADTVINSGHIRGDIYGTSFKYWFISPSIDLAANIEDGVMLSVDLGLVPYSSSYAASRNTGMDDRFMIIISEDGGATWKMSNATIWDNDSVNHQSGRSLSYNGIPEHGTTYRINLTQYTGKTIAIAFYGESTVSNADNWFHFGNIHLNSVPAAQVYDTTCYGGAYEGYDFEITRAEYKVGDNIFNKVTPAVAPQTEDSITVLHLYVRPSAETDVYDTICYKSEFAYGSEILYPTTSGDYPLFGLTTKYGCDSLVNIHLTVLPDLSSDTNIVACESFEYKGQTYWKDVVIEDTLTSTSAFGCDSIVTMYVKINAKPATTDEEIILCENGSYEWNGQTITAAGEYTYGEVMPSGCDSTVTLYVYHGDADGNINATFTEGQLPQTVAGNLIDKGTVPGTYTFGPYTTSCGTNGIVTVVITRESEGLMDAEDAVNANKVVINDILYLVVGDNWFDANGRAVAKPE